MPLQTYMRILLRRGWILLLAMVLTSVSAFAFSRIMFQRAPVYKSTIKVLVMPARTDFGQAQAAKTLLNSYVSWLDSNYRAADVINSLQLDTTPEELRSHVTIASDNLAMFIQIDVENQDGNQANDIARKWAELFLQWRDEENQKVRLEDRIDAQIIDDPKFVLDFPKTGINTIAGAVFGLLVGMAVVFVLEYSEAGIIRTHEDVDRALNVPILGTIPPAE